MLRLACLKNALGQEEVADGFDDAIIGMAERVNLGPVVAYSTSDERLKTNIQLIGNPVEKVQQLKGVEFDWKDGMPKAGQHEYGVIAQDVFSAELPNNCRQSKRVLRLSDS